MRQIHSFMKIRMLLILMGLFLIPYLSIGQGQKSSKATPSSGGGQIKRNQPMVLNHADHFSSDSTKENGQVTRFWGHVDIMLEADRVSITADTVLVYSSTNIYLAVGHVKIIKEDPIKGNLITTSQKAKYEQTANRITLSGIPKPVIVQGKNKMTGDIFVITTSPEGTTIEGDNVTGYLVPESKDTTQ